MSHKKFSLLLAGLIMLFAVCVALFVVGCEEEHIHTWDSGVETTEATHTQTGIMTYTCTSCGETKTETIEKIEEHTYVNGKCKCGAVDENYLPDKSYFIGNIFQIVGLDLGKQPYDLGTGFVINNSGYFIINAHVMEDVYYAYAIFEIPNKSEGESFTKLDIQRASICNTDKDIFVGIINNYSSIASYYSKINIATDYEVGDITYSVGYADSATYLQINKGVALEKDTFIYDKINGIEYVVSTSYIAPGSSGGILLNSDLEIIGMTTGGIESEDGEFEYGYSISAYNFVNYVNNAKNYNLYVLANLLHADYIEYINYFESISASSDFVYSIDEYGTVYYTNTFKNEGTNTDGYKYTLTRIIRFGSDYSVIFDEEIYWDGGHMRNIYMYGYWVPDKEFENLSFLFGYEFSSSSYYIVYSDDINYNSDTDLTLLSYEVESSSSHTLSDYDITYAKEQFNRVYEEILSVGESNS